MRTRDEWQKSYGKVVIPSREPELKQAIISVVALEHLTTNEDFNRFLTHINGNLEQFKAQIPMLEAQILHPKAVSVEKILETKIALAFARGTLEALEWVIALPKALLENGKIARELYAKTKDQASK